MGGLKQELQVMTSKEKEKEKEYQVTIKDEEGNVLYFSRQPSTKGFSVPLGKILQLKQRHDRVNLRKPRT